MKRYTTDKDLNRAIRDLERDGWTVEHGKHLKVRSPSGKIVTCSKTPSCGYAVDNFLRDVKRIGR